MRKWLLLNVKFNTEGKIECAKSIELCKDCPWGKYCEELKCYYDPYDYMDYCRKNNYKKR